MTGRPGTGVLPRFRNAVAWRVAGLGRVIGSEALLFHELALKHATKPSPDPSTDIRALSEGALTDLRWLGNPFVWTEFQTWSGDGSHDYLVARSADDSVVGICAVEWKVADITFMGALPAISADACYLSRVHIAPAMRGMGIGHELTIAAASHARAGGASRMISACVPSNLPMRALFSSLGWSESGAVRRWHLGPISVFAQRSRSTDRTRYSARLATL